MRSILTNAVNVFLKPLGARAVNLAWGPRGYLSAFARVRGLGFKPATIIDIGASDGGWTRECRGVFPNARFALFDALPEHEEPIRSLAAATPGITYWRGALGAAAGKVTFNAHGHQSSVLASTSFPGKPFDVEVRPLDSFIEPMKFLAPMLIKADVQGYEIEVLKGAARCLEMTEAILLELSFRKIYEGSPLAHDVIAWLGARGFRIYDICSYAQRAADAELLQADVMFVREGSALFRNEGWT